MKIDFYQKARETEEEIRSYYTHLHRYPELSGQEYKTQEWILGSASSRADRVCLAV